VEVDRPVADGAAPGQRHARAALAREHRAQHEDGRAHGLDEVVGGLHRRELAALSSTTPPTRMSVATPMAESTRPWCGCRAPRARCGGGRAGRSGSRRTRPGGRRSSLPRCGPCPPGPCRRRSGSFPSPFKSMRSRRVGAMPARRKRPAGSLPPAVGAPSDLRPIDGEGRGRPGLPVRGLLASPSALRTLILSTYWPSGTV
jgi:hypothetical protein